MYNVKAVRAINGVYTNNNSNVMFVSVSYTTAGGNTLYAYSDGVLMYGGTQSWAGGYSFITFPVSSNKTYQVKTMNAGTVQTWTECR